MTPLPPGWSRCPLCGELLSGPWTAYVCPTGWLPLNSAQPLARLLGHALRLPKRPR